MPTTMSLKNRRSGLNVRNRMRSALLQSIVKISFSTRSTRIKEGTGNGELFLSSSITISNLVAEKVPREARFWFEDHCAGKVNSSLAGERQRDMLFALISSIFVC